MRRSLGLVLMISLIPTLLHAASRDVNRDGRVDREDVRALGRMVAGLDPVDLSFDQNGDHALTLDDVNLLLDSLPAESGSSMTSSGTGSATAGPTQGPAAGGNLVFYALRQKAGGRCVVVAGEEGISPGDTVLGAFPDFQQAQYEVVSRCRQAASSLENTSSLPVSSEVQPHVAEEKSPAIVSVAAPARGGETKGVYLFNLHDGRGFYIDQIGKKAYDLRKRKLRRSIFEAVGRTSPASPGEILVGPICGQGGDFKAILVVDTPSGKMGYLSGLDVDPTGGRPVPIAGNPAADLAGQGGNFALMMRKKGSGKTLGAYLYRAATGDCRIFRDVGSQPESLISTPTSRLPACTGSVGTCSLLNGAGATTGMLVLDEEGGRIYHVEGLDRDPTKFRVRQLNTNLRSAFPGSRRSGRGPRFLPLAINDASGETKSVLILDRGSGGMAVLENLKKGPRLTGLSRNVYDLWSGISESPGMLVAAGRIDGSGRSKGAWIFDSTTPEILYLKGLQERSKLAIRKVVFH